MEIVRAKNGKEKQETYAKYMVKYNLAMKYGFYLEAIVVDYAMLEDRLTAFLHYVGVVTRTHEKLKVNKRYYPQIRSLLGRKPNACVNVSQISTKREIITALLHISFEEKDAYLKCVKSHISASLSEEALLATIENIAKWCDTRNQYVHALLNKNCDDLEADLRANAEIGMRLAREMDSYVDLIKKKNTIRKKFNIQ